MKKRDEVKEYNEELWHTVVSMTKKSCQEDLYKEAALVFLRAVSTYREYPNIDDAVKILPGKPYEDIKKVWDVLSWYTSKELAEQAINAINDLFG